MCSAVVDVEVFVHIEDEVCGAAVGVLDFLEGCAGAVGDEGAGGGVVCAWQEDFLVCGACGADGCYDCLHGGGPRRDVYVVL